MDKKLYLIAEFDEKSQITLKDYEKIIAENGLIGKQTKDIPYHITLCSFPTEMENSLKELLDKLIIKHKKININFIGFGLFGLNVLFLNPTMNFDLMEIHNYLKKDSFEKDRDFAPHLTLLIDEPENILKLLPKMVEKIKTFSGIIKYVSLFEFFPVRFIKRIELN